MPKQEAFITCPADDVGFGGARGGGKSDAIVGDFINHEEIYGEAAIGMAFRRTRTQLVELIERAKQVMRPIGYSWHEQDKFFRGPKGGRLRFSYLESDSDADAYQGHSYTRIYPEEMGTFPNEAPIRKLQATLRSGHGVPCQMKGTCNPGGAGHQWVKARYRLDTHRLGMQPFTFEFENPFTKKKITKTRIFIPSLVTDNRYLGDDYIANLYQVGSAALVKAWLEGDWDAIEGAFFDCWSSKNVVPPFAIPKDWVRFRSGDWGSASPFSFGWWAVVQDDYDIAGRVLPRGALVRYREWYGSTDPASNSKGLKLTAEEMGEGIAKRERDEKLAYGVLDPRCFAVESGPSIAERINSKLIKAKMASFREADNKRINATQSKDGRGPINGWDQMRARIVGKLDDDGKPLGVPMIYCFSTCVASIRTIPVLQHDPDKAEDLDTESEDHAADDWRYACSSRPWTKTVKKPDEPKDAYRTASEDLADVQSSVKLS